MWRRFRWLATGKGNAQAERATPPPFSSPTRLSFPALQGPRENSRDFHLNPVIVVLADFFHPNHHLGSPAPMTLREQLKELLPSILPGDPNDAIKGTELIRLTKFRLRNEYSDATLRYHFSVMSCDPSTPIAKVSQGQGYYLRHGANDNRRRDARNLIAFHQPVLSEQFQQSPAEMDRNLIHAGKFRAIVGKYLALSGAHVFDFAETFAGKPDRETVWRFPDALAVSWPGAVVTGEEIVLPSEKLRRALAAPICRLTTLKLRLRVDHQSLREEIFQCVSHSEWAHSSDFFIATPIHDATLAEETTRLGQAHGVGVLSMGFTPEVLDGLPEAGAIEAMTPSEVEAALGRGRFHRLSLPQSKPQATLGPCDPARESNPDLEKALAWISRCLEAGAAPIAESDSRHSPPPSRKPL